METFWEIIAVFGIVGVQIGFVVFCAIALVYFLLKRLKERKEEKFEKRKY